MRKLLAGLGMIGVLVAGIGLALVASGASADPAQRDATVVNRDGDLEFFGDFDRDEVVVSGRDTDCCLTIASQDTISGSGGGECSYANDSFRKIICDATSFAGVVLLGNSGNDRFEVKGKRLTKLEIRGGEDNDKVLGSEARERIFGGTEDDSLKGGGGRDRIDGEEGTDRCRGSNKAKIENCES